LMHVCVILMMTKILVRHGHLPYLISQGRDYVFDEDTPEDLCI
jgi:hypothetical protein